VLALLREDGREVTEGTLRLDDLRAGLASGDVVEVFACGTAAVLTPVGRLASVDFDLPVADGATGPVTAGVRARLTDIQYGRAADPHGWMYRLA
jgi:branched-chain amino acid aminotransferase